MDRFLAFLWTFNWYEWYVSEGPGVEFKVRLMSMRRTCAAAWYARAHPNWHGCNFSELHWTDFAIQNKICRLNIRKSRSSALKNDNKVARQVFKRYRESSRIRKAELCRTMQKRSKRKGLKFLLRQYIPRPSELHSLCKVEIYKLWLLEYSGTVKTRV